MRIEFGVCVYRIFILVSTRCGCMELSDLDDVSSAVFRRYAALIRELKKSSSVFIYGVCLFSHFVSTVVLEKRCEKEIMNCRKKNLPAFCLFFIVFGPMLLVRRADSRLLTGVVVGSDEDTLHPLALPP